MKIALIAPPWPLFNRPSIQIAVLKAYLLQQDPELQVRCMHPYLELASRLGFEGYHKISQSSWAAESVCAGILFPEQADRCNRLFNRALKTRASITADITPDNVRNLTAKALEDFVQGTDWSEVELVGLSACLNQLTSSLWIAKKIKEISPQTRIALGGASCAGPIGSSLLSTFPQLDYVINGEGEEPLLALVRYLEGQGAGPPPGVSSREGSKEGHPEKNQIKHLDELPAPDYTDYFKEITLLPPSRRFFPVLPVEFSRGCWWGRCEFCNLNLQWSGYRAKSTQRMVREILYLAKRYRTLDFSFTDNVLPRKAAVPLFKALGAQGLDLNFFAELRAVHSRKEIHSMAQGGLSEIQVGIEALSSSLLSRLGKGVRLIDNLAAMRHAEEAGIRLSGNLIIHFPGSTEEEVEETLKALDFVWPYRPLKTVSFWLGMESPVHLHPHKYSLKGIKSHPFFSDLFPKKVMRDLKVLVLAYRGDRGFQKRIWKRVEDKVQLWQRKYASLSDEIHPLFYRDGGDYIIIRRALPDGGAVTHRLSGLSRKLYLLCTDVTPLAKVFDQATGLDREKVLGFIRDLQQKRLMFTEDDMVLSLAVHRTKSAAS